MSNGERFGRLKRQAATTPGLLVVVTAGLVVVGLLYAVIGLVTVERHTSLVRDVGSQSGPLSVQAQNIYRSLSDADATAASAFLANGAEPAALRTRYLNDLATAGAALAVALRGADDRGAARLRVLALQLPVYAGLVETARSYNRQGLPLGAAYLREASGLMRQTLLPAAQGLFGVESDRLSAAQRDAAAFPWLLLLFGVVTLVTLVAAQRFLARRTNRLLNVGLAAATLAALFSLLWSTVALTAAASQVDAGRRDGSAQFQLLAKARVAALQARADESLTLVARGDGARFETDYTATMHRLIGANGNGGLLATALAGAPSAGDRTTIQNARRYANDWLAGHRHVRTLDDGGQYLAAVALATGPGPQRSASVFGQLDAALARGITAADARFGRQASDAAGALTGAAAAIVLPALLFLVGAVGGVQRRIGEYR